MDLPTHLRRLCALVLLAPSALAAVPQTLESGVAFGDVSQTTAILWARADTPGPITLEFAPDRDLVQGLRTFVLDAFDVDLPVKRIVRDLQPGTRYYLRATDAAGSFSGGTFRTPDALGVRRGLRFGVTGDSRGDNAPFHSMVNVPCRQLDLLIELGDTIYADVESPALPGVQQASTLAEFRRKHAEILETRAGLNSMVEVRKSTPLLATIDDHEVTNDFAGGADPSSDPRFGGTGGFINETALFLAGLQAFQEWHPVGNEFYGATGEARTAFKRKLYRRRWYGSDAAIHVLDARSFRDEGLVPANPLNQADIQRFLVESFDPTRTLLGRVQIDELLADLLEAQTAGITWKFVMVPEPIQNLGVAAASDRFEGYAAERTEILDFVSSNGITNVVFVAADIHGTVVNDLQYQLAPGGPQVDSGAFEISTGAIAYDAPFGPTVVQLAASLGLLGPNELALYQSLPTFRKDLFVQILTDGLTGLLGYTPIGIEAGGPVDATLELGNWTALHTWGWTEFEIAPGTGVLTVSTWGVEPFAARSPRVVQRFTVRPH